METQTGAIEVLKSKREVTCDDCGNRVHGSDCEIRFIHEDDYFPWISCEACQAEKKRN